MSRARVLVVDDDVKFREYTAMELESCDYQTAQAGSGDEAIAWLDDHEADLVVADIQMPGNDQLELVETLHNLPVILITGHPSMETAIKAVNCAVAAYVVKPFEIEELSGHIERILERQQAQKAADLAHEHPHVRGLALREQRGDERFAALSKREQEVVWKLCEGHRVPMIAKTLFISPHTVRNHLKSIFEKIGVRSQSDLLEWARAGLDDEPEAGAAE